MKKHELVIFKGIVVPNFEQIELEAKWVFITNKGGIKIQMFSKKFVPHPTLLYGRLNYNITPNFNVGHLIISRHLWVVFVVANIRGRSEYGEKSRTATLLVSNGYRWFGSGHKKGYESIKRSSLLKIGGKILQHRNVTLLEGKQYQERETVMSSTNSLPKGEKSSLSNPIGYIQL